MKQTMIVRLLAAMALAGLSLLVGCDYGPEEFVDESDPVSENASDPSVEYDENGTPIAHPEQSVHSAATQVPYDSSPIDPTLSLPTGADAPADAARACRGYDQWSGDECPEEATGHGNPQPWVEDSSHGNPQPWNGDETGHGNPQPWNPEEDEEVR